MKIYRSHYDVCRRALLMVLKHFDSRFAWRDGSVEPVDSITWDAQDFNLVRRAFLMILRHAEKASGWQ